VKNFFFSQKFSKFRLSFLLAGALAVLAGCGAGGVGGTSAASGVGAAAAGAASAVSPTAANLILSASPPTVKADGGLTSTTITVTALNAANSVVPGVPVSFSVSDSLSSPIPGILGVEPVTTGTAGTATVTFSAGASRFNRIATITATAGGASQTLTVQIVSSIVVVTPSGTTLPDNQTSPVTLTIIPKDAVGNPVPSTPVSLVQTASDTGRVIFTPASGITDPTTGMFTSVVTGTGAGSVNPIAKALGATGTTKLTVSPSAATFGIDQLTLNARAPVAGNPGTTAMAIGTCTPLPGCVPVGSDSLAVRVNAPTQANVTFSTSTGVWNGTTNNVVTVPVVAGKATATLTTAQAGVATVQVYDPLVPATSGFLTVGMTSATAASLTLQPSPGVVSRSGGSITSSTLTAMVRDTNGFPVGGAPVAFSIVNPTGGGETVSPVVAFSAAVPTGGLSLGQASTTFTSGGAPSGAGGIQVRASVVGTAIATNTAPSGSDATIVIGGTPGSVAFGEATTIGVDASNADYVWPMSILVTDSNGNAPPLGTVVNLSIWPIAWSTGTSCSPDADGPNKGTFYNEDVNENTILDSYTLSNATVTGGTTVTVGSTVNLVAGMPISGDNFPAGTIIQSITNGTTFVTSAAGTNASGVTLQTTEDGTRVYYNAASGVATGGTQDGQLTPPNSASGSVPVSVTLNAVDANGNPTGAAPFNLTYTKGNALWIIDRIRARTVVQGSASVGEIDLRLEATTNDIGPPCLLPPSPYHF
jgi:hypothetical protein